jgi:hypothetical protein
MGNDLLRLKRISVPGAFLIVFVNVSGPQGRMVANHMDAMTSSAFLEVVIRLKHFPMTPLTGHDYSSASAQRTNAFESGDHSGPYEFRPVWDAFHGVS